MPQFNDIIVKELPWVDARGYSAPAGQTILQAILNAKGFIGNNNRRTLLIAPGNWVIQPDPLIPNNNLIIPSNINLRFEEGSLLQIQDGMTFTIKGSLEAPLSQIFELQGTGKVYFSSSSIREIYPQWWGAKGDGINDDTTAIQSALDASSDVKNSNVIRTVVLPDGTYLVSNTLQINCDLRGQTSPHQGAGAVIKYTGLNACLENKISYTVGMQIKNIRFYLENNIQGTETYAILCTDGHVMGIFENINIKCKTPRDSTVIQNGIGILGSQPEANSTVNQFINISIADADYGIWVGGIGANAMGSNTVILGGIILRSRKAAIKLTGGQNQIIGGDHSAIDTGTVILFDGSFCQNNTIIATEMECASNQYCITIRNNPDIDHVFTATSFRTLVGNFVNDEAVGGKKQRWVAIHNDATVEAKNYIAKLYSQAKTFYAEAVDYLSTTPLPNPPGPFDGSIIGQGIGKALEIKAGSEANPGIILLGRVNAPGYNQITFPSELPVTTGGVTLMIAPGGRFLFVLANTIGNQGSKELANMDQQGSWTIQGQLHFMGTEGREWRYTSSFSSLPTTGIVPGEIAWHNDPTAGDPIGWVFIGGVWHPFGRIE